MTGTSSEWFNMVLSLIKRQQHIKPFRGHSCHSKLILKRKFFEIEMKPKWLLEERNDQQMKGMIVSWIRYWLGMTEWCRNEMNFRIKGFAFILKYPFISPHSVIPSSFINEKIAQNDVKMTRMTIEWYLSIVVIIPCHSQMTKEWWNEEEWGCFWKGRKN